jgi:hypothetical protein
MPAFGTLTQRFVAVGVAAGIALMASVPLVSGGASAVDLRTPTVTPATTTALRDGATGQPWTGIETTGAAAYDTATVSGTGGSVPTGTLTYTFFQSGSCQGGGSTETVTLVDGVPPDATTTAALGAGAYSYDAVYNDDGNDNPSAVSSCEPFTVNPAPTGMTNLVHSRQTGGPWSGTETAGGKAYDTASVSGTVPGFVPTGTVTYLFYVNGTCGGTSVWTDTVSLTGTGDIPNSTDTDALGAGTYSFDARYNGDENYAASPVSACQAFVVTPITDLGPTLDPSGSTSGSGYTSGSGNTDMSGSTGGNASTPASSGAEATGSAPAVASSSSGAGPSATAVTAIAATPAGPETKSALAWTGANIGVTASIALGLLVLGSMLVAVGRRRRDETS